MPLKKRPAISTSKPTAAGQAASPSTLPSLDTNTDKATPTSPKDPATADGFPAPSPAAAP